jgi:phenylacetate-CoA ligase
MNNPHSYSPELLDVIRFARVNSAFYHDLYQHLPEVISSIHQVPILNQDEFWSANTLENNRLLTERPRDGIILKSGGTTGKPKFSAFSRDEWSELTQTCAHKLAKSALKDGDRVANLFYAGELYGSFLFTHLVLEECPVRLLQLPIGGTTAIPTILKLIQEYEATVIAGLPTTLLSLASQVTDPAHVKLILFAGEPLQLDQRAYS